MPETQPSHKVVVLGVGTGGCRIAAELAQTPSADRLEISLIDTDEKALECYPEFKTVLIGSDWADKQGCGCDMARGSKAASSSSQELQKIIKNSDLLIVICPLGGGTGSGAVPVIANISRNLKILSLFLVTKPFSFEGNLRFKNAEKSVKDTVKQADALICIENDIIFNNLSGNFSSDFKSADQTLADCVAGLAEMLFTDGLIKIDFVHVKQLVRKKEVDCHIGIGRSSGEDKSQAAINDLLQSPTLGGSENLKKSDAAIITLLAGPDLSMSDINECITAIKELFSDKAEINIGVSTSSDRENFLQLTVLTIRHRNTKVATPTKKLKKRKARKKEESIYNIQDELPLLEMTSGIFENMAPTMHHGINLDIPTYMRDSYTPDLGPQE